MNKLLTIILILLTFSFAHGKTGKSKIEIARVDPPYWWTGMNDSSLQLMLYGNNIASCNLQLNDYKHVSVDSVVRLDSPNYLFVYLNVEKQAAPGFLDFKLSDNKYTYSFNYELKPLCQMRAGRAGFDARDVLYLVMPDRFADGDTTNNVSDSLLRNPVKTDRFNPNARHGGDIQGIINNISYLENLGVTALWSCPVLENDMPGGSYHGYATTDYYRIDPRFGSNQKWQELVSVAHSHGIKVVMDMIFNHTGVAHPWMNDMPSKDWYNHPEGNRMTNFRLSTLHDPYVSQYDLESTTDGWFVSAMPDLNQRNPHLLKYLIQNSIWWIEYSAIDGIRMDTYPYADAQAMAQWISAVENQYPDFDIVGECWYGDSGAEAFWQHDSKVNPVNPVLKTVMDFGPTTKLRQAFAENTDPWSGLNKVYDHLSLDFLFTDPQRILTFLDNHDTDRWLIESPDSLGRWKQAVTWLLTSRGIPQLYYGTEVLMHGTKDKSDGYVRRDMPGGFPGDSISVFVSDGRSQLQNEAFNFLSHLLNWRKTIGNDVIANGRLKHFMPQQGLYVYSKKLNDKEIVVLMNGCDEAISVNMTPTLESLPIDTEWRDVISGNMITVSPQMNFDARQILILQNF